MTDQTSQAESQRPAAAGLPGLVVNSLAVAYQPRREWAALISIAWNLLWVSLFLLSGMAAQLHDRIARLGGQPAGHFFLAPAYITAFFAIYALANFPLELWLGYLEERQFGLTKGGIRSWTWDWLNGTFQHGVMFIIGTSLIVLLQALQPMTWLIWASLLVLALFLATVFFAANLVPKHLFEFSPAPQQLVDRLRRLAGPLADQIPPVIVFSEPNLRAFSGGLLGLGRRQVLLVSQSTVDVASDALLRFVLLHELGHRRFHHMLLSVLTGWAWITLGLVAGDWIIAGLRMASPVYIAWLSLTLTLWMALGQPLLAYIGRRLEYQADRFYLRNGGTLEEMHAGLTELSSRNLARTDRLSRRQTIFHPLPCVANRLSAARTYADRLSGGH